MTETRTTPKNRFLRIRGVSRGRHPGRWCHAWSESPAYVGCAIASVVADPNLMRRAGGSYASWNLARQYGFTDYDGRRPNWDQAITLYQKRRKNK